MFLLIEKPMYHFHYLDTLDYLSSIYPAPDGTDVNRGVN